MEIELSVIVPAHNEESRIRRMLDAYLPYFAKKYGNKVEFLVVVNGSTDATADIVNSYISDYPQLRCIIEQDPIGKGGAVIRGFEEAKGTLLGFSDADGSTPPQAFQDLIDNIGEEDSIIASRWRKDSIVSPRQPLIRRTASRVFNILTRFLFGLKLTDTQCGAKLFRSDSVRDLLPSLGITRWAFDVDLLFQLRRVGRSIVEIPTEWHDVAGSKIQVTSISVEMAAALLRLRLLYSPLKWVVAVYDKTLGPFMHPAGLAEDRLFRHSFLLMSGAQISNIANMIFQAAMVRMLGRNNAVAYGEVYTMLSVYAIIMMPLGALGRTVTHFTAKLLAVSDGPDAVRYLVRHVIGVISVVGAVFFAVVFISRYQLAAFFRLDTSVLILITAVALLLAMYQTIITGVMTGVQAFVWFSVIVVVWGVVRLFLAIGLVAAGGGAASALSAHTLALAISLLVSVYGLRLLLGKRRQICRAEILGIYGYLFKFLFALLGYSVLMSADAPLVKHYFNADTAGLFAKSTMVAHIVIFLPLPVAGALFPKVVSSGGTSRNNARTLAKAVFLVASIVACGVLTCTILTKPVLNILIGESPDTLVHLTRTMVLAFAPLCVVFVLMNFELAQNRFFIAVPLFLCATLYLVGVSYMHTSLYHVAWILGGVNTLALVLSIACLPWRSFLKKNDAG